MATILSVADILELGIMQRAKLVHNPGGLEGRRVDWVSVIEVPVENFVRPNELVLTTAMGIGHRDDLLGDFVGEVAASGAAALAIATGQYVHALPRSAVETARSRELPLLELPWDLPFSEISETMLRRMINKQNVLLNTSLNVQRDLLSLVASGATLQDLAVALARLLRRPVAFLDGDAQVAAGSSGWDPGEELPSPLDVSTVHKSGVDSFHELPGSEFGGMPVRAGGRVQAYLIASTDPPFTEMDYVVLNHGATAASMCLLQEMAAKQTEARLRSDFVWSLATGHVNSLESAVAQGALLGYDVSRSYVGVVGRTEVTGDAAIGDIVARSQDLLKCCTNVAQDMQRRVMGTVTGEKIVLFVEAGDGIEDIPPLVRRLAATIEKNHPRLVFSWGIGDIRPGFSNFRLTYEEADQACQIGRAVQGPGHVTSIGETGVFRVLYKMTLDQDLPGLLAKRLQPLLLYQREKDIDILKTIEVYFQTGRNASKAAQRLHLHRQSLAYRLQKIEELTGYDLNDPHDCFHLELILQLYRLSEVGSSRRDRDG